jgi:hypothetical protein
VPQVGWRSPIRNPQTFEEFREIVKKQCLNIDHLGTQMIQLLSVVDNRIESHIALDRQVRKKILGLFWKDRMPTVIILVVQSYV